MQQMIIRPWVFPGLARKPVLNPDAILETVCEHFDIKQEILLARSRRKKTIYCRQVYTYLCRTMLNLKLGETGKLIGRDHTTVINTMRRINALLDTEDIVRDELRAITNHLKANYRLVW